MTFARFFENGMRVALSFVMALLLAACGDGEPPTPANALLPDGARYRGALVNGLLQGEGRLDYANGSWFKGHFKDGQPDGPGEWHGAAGEHYVGSFKQGLFNGQGRLTLSQIMLGKQPVFRFIDIEALQTLADERDDGFTGDGVLL